jgi:protein-S-isoprenylcysteine O-methyltransferase Ste14
VALREELEATGTWLFQKRSYVPLLVIVPVLWSLRNYQYPEGGQMADELWEIMCLVIGLIGLAIRCFTVGHVAQGTSGRTTRAPAADTLNVTGMYSIVRHPLYLGNYFMWLGPALFPRSLATVLIVTLIFWLYYERIMLAEEGFLRARFGATFEEWAQRTPAIVPRLGAWIAPERQFSIHAVLKRESSGLLGLLWVMAILELAGELAVTGHVTLDPLWVALLSPAVALVLVMRVSRRVRRARADS